MSVKEKSCKVYFGGSYTENWTQDYTLSIRYSERQLLYAISSEDGWRASLTEDGSPDFTASAALQNLCTEINTGSAPELTLMYFRAAAEAYDASRTCLKSGDKLLRLEESYHASDNPLIAPELLRLLMDDCGFALNKAFRVVSRCCDDCRATGIDTNALYKLQPRTAHVVLILRETVKNRLSPEHMAYDPFYRAPQGAVRCGDELTLRVKLFGGTAEKVTLVLRGLNAEARYPCKQSGNVFSATIVAPFTPGSMEYYFMLETEESTNYLCPGESGYSARLCARPEAGYRLTVYRRDFETPAWFRRSVMYQIFPDRFAFSNDGTAEAGIEYHRSLGQTPDYHADKSEPVKYTARPGESAYAPDDFYGGTLKGIMAKLPYLKHQGIGCIYLNPIVESRSNHRYDASDYLKVDPVLGNNTDFTELTVAAEKLGIRVILDGVYSHTGADSVYFNRNGNYPGLGACQGRNSPYYPWYDFKAWPNVYRSWWGFTDLPEVDEMNPQWQEFVISGENSVVKTWLRRGAAGWRLDVADELPDEALSLIRKSVKDEKPDAPIIGEVWEDPVLKESYGVRRNYALGYSLDSVMNYPFRTAVLEFLQGRSNAFALRDFLLSQQKNYPQPLYYSLMNLLGTHDVPRLRNCLACDFDIRSLNREEQLRLSFSEERMEKAIVLEKLAVALQFSIPGVPSVYYGDEQGMRGIGDPFCRGVFREENAELAAFYAELAAMRNNHPALSTGAARFHAVNEDTLLVLRYVKGGADAFGMQAEDGIFLAAINRGGEPVDFEIPGHVMKEAGFENGAYRGAAGPQTGKIIRIM